MIKGLLAQYNIPAFVQGAFLQGGMGELPSADLVKVSIDNAHQAEAREIISEWEAGSVVEDEIEANLEGGALNGAS